MVYDLWGDQGSHRAPILSSEKVQHEIEKQLMVKKKILGALLILPDGDGAAGLPSLFYFIDKERRERSHIFVILPVLKCHGKLGVVYAIVVPLY